MARAATMSRPVLSEPARTMGLSVISRTSLKRAKGLRGAAVAAGAAADGDQAVGPLPHPQLGHRYPVWRASATPEPWE